MEDRSAAAARHSFGLEKDTVVGRMVVDCTAEHHSLAVAVLEEDIDQTVAGHKVVEVAAGHILPAEVDMAMVAEEGNRNFGSALEVDCRVRVEKDTENVLAVVDIHHHMEVADPLQST